MKWKTKRFLNKFLLHLSKCLTKPGNFKTVSIYILNAN